MDEQYIQIGYTALRNPANGEFLPAVPLYIKAEDGAAEAEQRLIDGLGWAFAQKMEKYIEGCNEARIPL